MKRRNFIKTTSMSNAGIIAAPGILMGAGWKATNDKIEKIKIGQIGISHSHAAGKINTLKKMPDVYEIVGVVDDGAGRFSGDSLKPYKGLRWMSEEELFNTPGLQAVTVETSNLDLVPAAIRCMERNLAIHMDKPGGEDLELFGKLLKGCKDRNLPFQMGYMFRNNPAFQFCLKAVREGWLGNIAEIHADMSYNYGNETFQRYVSNYKGGVVFLLTCHHIDFVTYMLGRPDKVTSFLKSTPGAANGAKNNCLTVLEYPHTIVSLSTCGLKTNGLNKRHLKISGSKGMIELSPLERFDGKPLQMQLTLLEGNEEYPAGSHTVDFGIKRDRYEDQLLELAKIIRGEIKNTFNYKHEYLTQEVVMAASGLIE
jgi:predicted dehydrogenase